MRYKLYVLKPYEQKIEDLVAKYKYVRASIFYVLVYTNKKALKSWVRVKRPQVLNAQEKAWITACNMKIEEELFQNSKNAAEAMGQFLKDLESELKVEQAALRKEG